MFNFKRKDLEFFDLFVESAGYFYKGALMMDEVMLDYSKAEAKMKEIIDLEHEADAVNDKIIDKLNQSVSVEAIHMSQLKKYVEIRKKAYIQNPNGYNYIVRMQEYNQLLKGVERLCHLMLNRQMALINIEKTIGADIKYLTREVDL